MTNPGSLIFLVLFAVITFMIYLAVRRGWLTLVVGGIIGGIANSTFFALYSLSQNNGIARAIFVGPVVGLFFTGATVVIAAYFRQSEKRAADAATHLTVELSPEGNHTSGT